MQTQALEAEPHPSRASAGLGLFSLSLGLTQLLAPGAITRAIAARDDERGRSIVRALGGAELALGVGLLARAGLRSRRQRAPELRAAVTISCSPDQVYRFWRDFENLPRFISHVESVRARDGHSRWWAKAPAGIELKWDAEITVDRPGELIAWQSLQGSDLHHHGAVLFKPGPGGRGTEVHLSVSFEPGGRRLTAAVARLLSKVSELQLRNDLRRLKQLLETGEPVLSNGSSG